MHLLKILKFLIGFPGSKSKEGNVLNCKIYIFPEGEKKYTSFEKIKFILILRYENTFC